MSFLFPAGAWLWGKYGDKVTEQAGKQLGEASRNAWGKINWQSAAERYRGEMQMLYGTMRIIGMTEPVALADIFTDVFLLDKPNAWRRYNIEELKRQFQPDRRDASDEQRYDAMDLVQRNKRLMILGKPGAGKTTLLKHLVLQCTTGKLDAVPIFVGLKAWTDSELPLMSFLTRQFAICDFPDAQLFIEHILKEGLSIVLFDGLDEVNLEGGARDRINREVRDFSDQYRRSRCVITCRTAASDYQFEHFTYCELADFTREQMVTFVTHWFQRNETKRNAFLADFAKDQHDRLIDLSRTPLLLTLLCLTFDETMTFPPRHAEIYEEAVDALLKKWDASRSIKRDTVYRALSLGHKRQLLTRIAAGTFAYNQLFIPQQGLVKLIEVYVQGIPFVDVKEEVDGEAILHAIEAQHGLLIERAKQIYSFSHLTFHEYFTARYIVEHPSEDMFRSVSKYIHDIRWREVLLLTASMLDDLNAKPFFESFDIALHTMIQHESMLLSLFQWLSKKSQDASTRELYLLLALITSAVSSLSENSNILIALDLARSLARNFARTFANFVYTDEILQNVDHDSTFYRDLDLARDLISILERIPNRDSNLNRDFFPTKTRIKTIATSIKEPEILQNDFLWTGILLWVQLISSTEIDDQKDIGYDELLNIWRQLATESQLIGIVSGLRLPKKDAPSQNWKQLTVDLRTALINHYDVGYLWTLDKSQLEHLAYYLDASNRMLECLDLAAIADRGTIRNRLLLPPHP